MKTLNTYSLCYPKQNHCQLIWRLRWMDRRYLSTNNCYFNVWVCLHLLRQMAPGICLWAMLEPASPLWAQTLPMQWSQGCSRHIETGGLRTYWKTSNYLLKAWDRWYQYWRSLSTIKANHSKGWFTITPYSIDFTWLQIIQRIFSMLHISKQVKRTKKRRVWPIHNVRGILEGGYV